MLFDELDDKYQKQINAAITGESLDEESEESYEEDLEEDYSEEDFNEEEYQAAIDEMMADHEELVHQVLQNFSVDLHNKLMDWLEDYFEDKFESDNFLGFLLSYLYKMLLDAKANGKLTKDEGALLKLFELPDANAENLIQSFYDSENYAFTVMDTFSRHYFEAHTDILMMRDSIRELMPISKISSLDEHYPGSKMVGEVTLRASEIYELCDMVFMKYKLDYPADYIENLYVMLTNTTDFEPVFYELDMDEDAMYCRIILIRYFCRVFIENIFNKDMNQTSVDEYRAFHQLMEQAPTNINIFKTFKTFGIEILELYEKTLNFKIANEKKNIRAAQKADILKTMALVDPMIIGDSTFYRALTDSKLYQYLEQNGLEQTSLMLYTLSLEDYNEARELLNEILVSIYMHAVEKKEKDSIEQAVISVFDVKSCDAEQFIKTSLSEISLLFELLEHYLTNEKDEDYPMKFEERIVMFPKVKEKLYPL